VLLNERPKERHPLNPIGESDSVAIKGFYVALLLAAFIAYWFRGRAYKIGS